MTTTVLAVQVKLVAGRLFCEMSSLSSQTAGNVRPGSSAILAELAIVKIGIFDWLLKKIKNAEQKMSVCSEKCSSTTRGGSAD